jgi:hypothetical protein
MIIILLFLRKLLIDKHQNRDEYYPYCINYDCLFNFNRKVIEKSQTKQSPFLLFLLITK